MSTTALLAGIADLGRDSLRGGYSRHAFDPVELGLREWFVAAAQRLGLRCEVDRNSNIWAWWGEPGPGAIVTGSHLDSVPGGGAFDGPLGVACALEAIGSLQEQGFSPAKPIAIGVFAEEEGGRFGVACLGSRLLTGAIAPERAARLTDADGITVAEAITAAGRSAERFGRDEERLRGIGCFVELHVEQGKALVDMGAPVGIADSIMAHGRWRFSLSGQGNHAGTTQMAERHDPMLPAAAAVLAARSAALGVRGSRATIGRITPIPGGTNVIASGVDFWLDARACSTVDTQEVVAQITEAVSRAALQEGCQLAVREESYGDTVTFDTSLRDRLAGLLGGVPVLPTGAGHDAGVLAAEVPTAMLFVRNPTGVSHAPGEYAEPADCAAGSAALARVLRDLAG